MQKAVIRVGDKTSHGGTVVTGDPTLNVFGQPAARKGDMTSCPKCKGSYPIVEGTQSTGSAQWLALEGMRTACGATLIASQHFWTEAPSAGDGSGASGAGPGTEYKAGEDEAAPYRGRFQVIDDTTRESVARRGYKISSMNGATLEGETDANGYTSWVEGESPDMLSLTLLPPPPEEEE